MSYTNSSCYNKKGYVVLLSILIVGAVGMAVTVSLLLLGLGSSRTSFAYEQSGYAKSLASACAEEALQQVRDSTSFTGSGVYFLAGASALAGAAGEALPAGFVVPITILDNAHFCRITNR